MAMGKLGTSIALFVVLLLLFAQIIGISAWVVQEHDKRAAYYKHKLLMCEREHLQP